MQAPQWLPWWPAERTLTRTQVVAQKHQDKEGDQEHPEVLLGIHLHQKVTHLAVMGRLPAGLRRGSHDGLARGTVAPRVLCTEPFLNIIIDHP